MNNDNTEELLEPKRSVVTYKSPKKKNLKFIIIGIIIVAILLVTIIGFFIYNAVFKSDEKYEENLNLGKEYLESGHYEDAVESFKEAINIKKSIPETYKLLGQSAILAADYSTAHSAYDSLSNFSDEKITGAIGNAKTYIAEDNYKEANKVLSNLKEEFPDNEQVNYNLNFLNSGNSPNNVMNGGEICYDGYETVYFVVEEDNYSTPSPTGTSKIVSYNLTSGESTVLVEETYEKTADTYINNLNIYNNKVYYNFGSNIISVNVYGNDRKVVSTGYLIRYISNGKIFANYSHEPSLNGDCNFIVLDLNGVLIDTYRTGIKAIRPLSDRQWIVNEDDIYFFTLTNNSYEMRLYNYNLNTRTVNELAMVYSLTNSEEINGIYIYDDIIYYSYNPSEVIYSYNLKIKENKKIELVNTEPGFTVDELYIIKGNKDSNNISFYNKNDLTLVKTIEMGSLINDPNQSFPSQNLLITGLFSIPNNIIFDRTFTKGESNTLYYMNYYKIQQNDWELSEFYDGNT